MSEIAQPSILYILGYREADHHRKRNIKICIDWLLEIKEKLKSKSINFDIFVIEQDVSQKFHPVKNMGYLFVYNDSLYNKPWGFNIAVKLNANYDYYGFGDIDLIDIDIDGFCATIVDAITHNHPTFKPFDQLIYIKELSLVNVSNFSMLCENMKVNHDSPRSGFSYSGGIIFMSKYVIEKIHGWDEIFEGWGFEDYAIDHKINILLSCKKQIYQRIMIHLNHPHQSKTIKFHNKDLLQELKNKIKNINDLMSFDHKNSADVMKYKNFTENF